jgi:hypothetical protein
VERFELNLGKDAIIKFLNDHAGQRQPCRVWRASLKRPAYRTQYRMGMRRRFVSHGASACVFIAPISLGDFRIVHGF